MFLYIYFCVIWFGLDACDHAKRILLLCLWPHRTDCVVMSVTTPSELCCYECEHAGKIVLLCQEDYDIEPVTTLGRLCCYACDYARRIMILSLWPRWADSTLNCSCCVWIWIHPPRVTLACFSLDGVHINYDNPIAYWLMRALGELVIGLVRLFRFRYGSESRDVNSIWIGLRAATDWYLVIAFHLYL